MLEPLPPYGTSRWWDTVRSRAAYLDHGPYSRDSLPLPGWFGNEQERRVARSFADLRAILDDPRRADEEMLRRQAEIHCIWMREPMPAIENAADLLFYTIARFVTQFRDSLVLLPEGDRFRPGIDPLTRIGVLNTVGESRPENDIYIAWTQASNIGYHLDNVPRSPEPRR